MELIINAIIQAVKEWKGTNPKEEDKKRLYENLKKYHERLKKACKEESKVSRLASDMAKDNLFSMVIGNNNLEEILEKLNSIDRLPRKQSFLKKQLCQDILLTLEKIWREIPL